MRLIDADVLENDIRKVLKKSYTFSTQTFLALHLMLDIIRDRETIRIKPVKYGRWIKSGGNKYPVYTCSKCSCDNNMKTPYCAYCGAKMDGGIEND